MKVKRYRSITFDEARKGGQLIQEGQRRLQTLDIERTNIDDDILSNNDLQHPPLTLSDIAEESEMEPDPETWRDSEPERGLERNVRPTRTRRLLQRYEDNAAIALRVDC
jgi:hypothetical protein